MKLKTVAKQFPGKKLVIFDIDGTLADRDSSILLPGVADWFRKNAGDYLIVLATNQGGVGLNHWMRDQKFGDPDKFPDETQALQHIHAVLDQLKRVSLASAEIWAYACYVYKSKKTGKYSPYPKGVSRGLPEWDSNYRKPNPGMLLWAMKEADVAVKETLMVGNSDDDIGAADNANVDFIWADDFFDRENIAQKKSQHPF